MYGWESLLQSQLVMAKVERCSLDEESVFCVLVTKFDMSREWKNGDKNDTQTTKVCKDELRQLSMWSRSRALGATTKSFVLLPLSLSRLFDIHILISCNQLTSDCRGSRVGGLHWDKVVYIKHRKGSRDYCDGWSDQGEPINGEEKGSKHRTLGHTVVNWSRGGEGVSHGDKSLLERYDWNQENTVQVRPR